MFLGVLRFALAALPVLFLARPAVSWGMLAAISLTLFVGQFALLFPAMAVGMPAGLASIIIQVQAFITIGIAAFTLGEKPTARQIAGSAVAFAGLAVVATTTGANGVTFAGFALAIGSAALWSVGNVLLRRAGKVDMIAMVSWLSLIAPLPLLVLSLILEGPVRIGTAVGHATWLTIGAVLYIAVISTTLGYAAWGHLLKLYPAATAAPFSLLVPVSGTISAALILHETFGPVRLAGMALILAGLAVLVIRRRQPILN